MKASDIDAVVIHCSATREGQGVRAADIDKWHKERGFAMIGYNYVIDLDGTVEVGRPLSRDGAHCSTSGVSGKPYNKHSIGICYVGGLDKDFFAHMEEIDLCWRMRNAGWRLACVPQSTVYHLGGGSLHYDNPRKNYLNHRNNLIMLYKNKQHPWGVLFVRFFLDYAAAFIYLLQGHPKSSKAVFNARLDFLRYLCARHRINATVAADK